MKKDFVCGMDVDEEKVNTKSIYKGEVYVFCSLVCKEKFDQEPEKYIKQKKGDE